MSPKKIYVVKRDGSQASVTFDEITNRIEDLCDGLDTDYIDPVAITKEVMGGLYPGITTVQLDDMAAEIAMGWSSKHPHFKMLAARIAVSNLHKETKEDFSDVIEQLHTNKNVENEDFCISNQFLKIIQDNHEILNKAIKHKKDFNFSYFEIKNLIENHLKKIGDKIVERPQHLLMRMAIAFHGDDIESVLETYEQFSNRTCTMPASAMARAGTVVQQLASAFSITMSEDSIEGIYDTLKHCGLIARVGGESGLSVSRIRGKGSYIGGTNGNSNGLIPMIRVYNSMARYTHQGGKKAFSNLTVILETWHADIYDFLSLKRNSGKEEGRARILSYALWIPDLFMKCVEKDEDWVLMCPDQCPNLFDMWGDEFEETYQKYVKENRGKRTVKARQLWELILESQIECGSPSILFKDNANKRSALKHLGTINGSSFNCSQMAVSKAGQPASCITPMIHLDSFVTNEKQFDFEALKNVAMNCVKLGDASLESCGFEYDKDSLINRERHIGIGVHGFANIFLKMELSFDSVEARRLNCQIFETIYYGALSSSCKLAKQYGAYGGFEGSPLSKGVFSFDMWNAKPSDLHDWDSLKREVVEHGVRNALLISLAASNESFHSLGTSPGVEPLNSYMEMALLQKRAVKVIHPLLVKILTDNGLWSDEMEEKIIANNGSIQSLIEIPESIRLVFRTSWEMSQKTLLEIVADRAPFIDQSQSVTVCMKEPNYGKISSMHFFAWKKGLKCGLYQLKTSAHGRAQVAEIRTTVAEPVASKNQEAMVCSLENKDECLSCGA